jgi:N-acetyl-1-D-myo-inositol-2-amino-2-deoxy-alpha-D-glucopyranoside deacetylase
MSQPESTQPESVKPAAEQVLDDTRDVVEQEQPERSMQMLDYPRRLLLVHAHPDDETINNGATMAKYAADGAHVTLVTCTLGEEGEVLTPGLEHLAADAEDGLGEHRISELATAMEALAVTDHRFLGGPGRYRDSGMMGVPSNDRPECFWRADVDDAAPQLVEIVREVRPQVLVTYDENGGYGHPDHIQTHRVALRAYELAADASYRPDLGAPWQIDKVYYCAFPRSLLKAGIDALRDAGDVSFSEWESIENADFVVDDDLVTTAVDATEHIDAKMAAMRAHATQIAVDGPFFALSNNLGQQVFGVEFYRLVHGQLGPRDGSDGREADLFAGVR